LMVLAPPVPGIAFTTRLAGNLRGGGSDAAQVAANRRAVSQALGIPAGWSTARQVHGRKVHCAGGGGAGVPEADALVVRESNRPIAVFVADCVPIALSGDGVAAAIHAGWRGLCAGVIEAAVAAARPDGARGGTTPPDKTRGGTTPPDKTRGGTTPPDKTRGGTTPPDKTRGGTTPPGESGTGELWAWIGPCIGPCCFEVGPEVPEEFAAGHPSAPDCSVVVGGSLHFELRVASAAVLEACGVTVAGGLDVPCTRCDPRFFSHRRDGTAARQALVTWVGGNR
jgi:copper oxidase (laccase) domain-containing protein